MKLKQHDGGFHWWCPGCNCAHRVNISKTGPPQWEWNGDMEHPTFSPSMLSVGQYQCHCFIRAGIIEFLADCTHALAGWKTPLPEWPFPEE